MYYQKTFLLLLLFFKITTYCFGQDQSSRFKLINGNYGLSQSFVHTLEKDSSGFIWAGTQNGLNRFDGYHFKQYHKQKEDSTSLQGSYIWSIQTDKNGLNWVGTTNGICSYDPKTDRFTRYHIPSNEPKHKIIRSILALDKDNVLIGTAKGVFLLNPNTRKFQLLHTQSKPELLNEIIYSFTKLNKDLILIGGREHLFAYRPASQQLRLLKTSASFSGGLSCVYLNQTDQLWVGSGKGLWQFNYHREVDSLTLIQHFLQADQHPSPISSDYITSFHPDQKGGLWIGTNAGINYLNTLTPDDGFNVFLPDPKNLSALKNYIFDLIEVESDILWGATQDGIIQFNMQPPIIASVDISNMPSGAGSSSMHGMVEHTDQNLLIATEKGLLRVEFTPDQVEVQSVINQQNTSNLADEFFVNIRPANDEGYWVALRRGGFGKLNYTNDQKYSWKGIKLPASSYSNVGCNDLLETANGDLWIASSGIGLWRWNQRSDKFTNFQKSDSVEQAISGNYIFQLREDSQGQLWIASADGGLCKMHPTTEQFTCFMHNENDPQSISSNMVLSIFEDSQNRIWACTANGINLYQADGSFLNFSTKNGLPNDVVYGMLEDAQGYLWVSTDHGLSRIVYDQGQFSCSNFTQESGLLKNEFNQHAFLKRQNGQMVFGTIGGISYFDPAKIKSYSVEPKVVFTDLKLFNESVPIKPNSKKQKIFHLNKHINLTETLVIPYDQNFLAFEFAGINFEEASHNQYAYQLVGLDQNWVHSGTRRLANYPNLKPGNYIFKVKAANHEGIWSTTFKSVSIKIAPPPWKTWWAYLIYLVSTLLTIYGIIWFRVQNVRRVEKAKLSERELFRKRSARDFHDEAGNQITKISLMTEIAKRKSNGNLELNNLVDQIGDEIQTLRSGMRDFIWVLDPDNDNLYETLVRLKEFANGIFEFSQIHFTTNGIDESLKSILLNGNQRRHLLLLFKEAINNSLKYSAAENAQFSVSQNEKIIELKFSDDGIGFEKENQRNGQGLKNIKSRAEKIGVEHVIFSEKNKGSAVSIFINITHKGN